MASNQNSLQIQGFWKWFASFVLIVMPIIVGIDIIIDRQVYFNRTSDPFDFFTLFPTLGFLVTGIFSVVIFLNFLIGYLFKKYKFNVYPIIFIIPHIMTVLVIGYYPTADFYQAYAHDLDKLASQIEQQYPDHSLDRSLDLQLPPELNSTFKDWPVTIYIRNNVLKIRVKISGGPFGGHRFMLYRSDGKDPHGEDIYRDSGPPFERKSDKWFLVNWYD